MVGVLAKATTRDGWDWLLYSLSMTAAFAAVIGFTYWTLEQRRRPEIEIQWSFSPKPETPSLGPWPADSIPELHANATVLVEVALLNVGDRAPASMLWNFVVPGSVQLKRFGRNTDKPLTAAEPTERIGPGVEIVFFAGSAPWPPGTWLALFFELTYTSPAGSQARKGRLVFEVSDSRFNGRGHRWLPSILPPPDPGHIAAGSPWPPAKRQRRRLGWISTVPKGRIACRPGVRQDVRDVTFVGG